MKKFVTWVFWTVCYVCRSVPRSLEGYLLRGTRTRWPWRKFRPSVWHNDDGSMWHVYLTDEEHFVQRRTLNLDVYVGQESGDVVGFDVWDENLKEWSARRRDGVHGETFKCEGTYMPEEEGGASDE